MNALMWECMSRRISMELDYTEVDTKGKLAPSAQSWYMSKFTEQDFDHVAVKLCVHRNNGLIHVKMGSYKVRQHRGYEGHPMYNIYIYIYNVEYKF